jgi:hypothetical protein
MTNLTKESRYQAQHRAPSSSHIPGRLPIAGSLAVLVVAGGTLAVSCTADQPEKASFQSSSTTSSVAAASPTAQQVVSTLTDDELANVKRVSWSLDGRLLAIHDKGTPLRSLGDLASLAEGRHKLTAVVELQDGRTLTLTAPFSSSGSSSDLTVDARAARSDQRDALAKQAAQKAQQQKAAQLRAQQAKQAQEKQRAQQQARAAAAVKQRAAQTKQVAQPAPTQKAAAPRPASVQKPTAVKAAPTQAAPKAPAPTQAAPKAPAPTQAAPKAPAPTQTAPAPTTQTTQPGSFDPVKFDWSSVGGPSKATSGSVTLSTASAALSNCNIGSLRVNADGPKISRCTINGGVYGPGGFTLDHSFVTSSGDGMDPTGPGKKVIQYNKIWRDGTRVGTKHQDGIQFWQGGNALISHNWIGGFQTSAIMVKADLGTISNVTIDSNYLHNPTGYFQLYLCKAGHDLKNITVTNNAFGKSSFTASTCHDNLTFVHTEAQRQAAIKAGNAGAASWIVWNNNYVAGTNAVVAPPGGWDQ